MIDLIVGLIATERRERRMEGGPLAPQDLQVLGMSQQRLHPHPRLSGRFPDRLLQDNLSRRREILLTTIKNFNYCSIQMQKEINIKLLNQIKVHSNLLLITGMIQKEFIIFLSDFVRIKTILDKCLVWTLFHPKFYWKY